MPLCTPCFQLRGKTLCLCALYFQLSYCEAASEDFCFAAPLMPKNATGGMLLPDLAELTNWSCNRSGLAVESVEPVLTLALDENMQNTSSSTATCSSFCSSYAAVSSQPAGFTAVSGEKGACALAAARELELGEPSA